MQLHEINDLKITNVTYIHDPEAMNKWIDLYVDLFKEMLLQTDMANSEQDEHII